MKLGLLCLSALSSLFCGHVYASCESNFTKSGHALKGTDYSSAITVTDLSQADAMAQMRGIMIGEKMDVITEDVEGGSMLVEQRSTSIKRAIPTILMFSSEGTNTTIEMTVKTEKGVFAKAATIQKYMCDIFAKVQGGAAGRAAAAQGKLAQNNSEVSVKDVFVFSREIAREAKGNSVAVNARHKGRNYALKGRIDYIQEDGEDYNVSFEIPEYSEMLITLPGDAAYRVGVACLFKPNQLAHVLTFREGQSANFTGTFSRYDDFKKMVWLENCKQSRAKR